MNAFCKKYSLSSQIKEPACCKNPANPSSIDLISTNSPRSFTTFERLPRKIRNYRDNSNSDNGMFRACLFKDLSKRDVGNLENLSKSA